jgi:two-component system chemotaxis response regulator CheY
MGTVLVVDDSATMRMQVSRALSGAGFEVIEAADGLDAMEKLKATPRISCVICDVNMPRMSGVEFVETLMTFEGPQPPVVMLTTEANPQLMQRAKAAGALGWLLKPFNASAVVATVTKLSNK